MSEILTRYMSFPAFAQMLQLHHMYVPLHRELSDDIEGRSPADVMGLQADPVDDQHYAVSCWTKAKNSSVLWSTFAQSHGVSISYHKSTLDTLFDAVSDSDATPFKLVHRGEVTYVDYLSAGPVELHRRMSKEADAETSKGEMPAPMQEAYRHADSLAGIPRFMRKDLHYRGEEEYRYVFSAPAGTSSPLFVPMAPNAILDIQLSHASPPWHREVVARMLAAAAEDGPIERIDSERLFPHLTRVSSGGGPNHLLNDVTWATFHVDRTDRPRPTAGFIGHRHGTDG